MIDNNADQSDISSPFTGPLPQTTDVIISQYENILSKRISSKIINSQKTGNPYTFTDEETSYLTKKAIDDNPHAEINVETSSPELTLKKGSTEIKIKHASAILKKMDEKFPLGMNKDAEENILRQPYINKSIEYGLSNPTDESDVLPMPIQTVNKNAYELRCSILENAINVVKSYGDVKSLDERVNDIMRVCDRFYAFVENKNNRKY